MDQQSKCVLCDDPNSTENPIFTCEDCNVSIHKLCYGITEKPGDFVDVWWCSPCGIGKVGAVCELCWKSGGALKKTTCGNWVHVLCALFTENVIFVNKSRMEPVKILHVSKENRGKKCCFCFENGGICVKCSQPDCEFFFHVTCGQERKCLKENINPKNKKIIFEAFCRQHKPSDSLRRISSLFVMDTLDAGGDEQDTETIDTISISSTCSVEGAHGIENIDSNDEIGGTTSTKSNDSDENDIIHNGSNENSILGCSKIRGNDDSTSSQLENRAGSSNAHTTHELDNALNIDASVLSANDETSNRNFWWDSRYMPKPDDMQAQLHANNEKIDKVNNFEVFYNKKLNGTKCIVSFSRLAEDKNETVAATGFRFANAATAPAV